jgi:hypothetical protein
VQRGGVQRGGVQRGGVQRGVEKGGQDPFHRKMKVELVGFFNEMSEM